MHRCRIEAVEVKLCNMQTFFGYCVVLFALVATLSAWTIPLQFEYDDDIIDESVIDELEMQLPWPINDFEVPLTTGKSTIVCYQCQHSVIRSTSGCSININARNAMADPQPLFIQPGTNRFFHPDTRNGFLRMDNGQNVELFCSAPGFAAPFARMRLLNATCLAGDEFLVHGRIVRLGAIHCIDDVAHTARVSRRAANPCPRNVTHIEIGFVVDAQRFLWTMDNCHDEQLESTLFSYHRQSPENGGFQRSIQRPTFTGGNFFHGRNVDRLYTGNVQRQTIAGIIGAGRVAQLWDDSQNWFLARGHLAARSDFIYAPEQRSTFYLMNAAPQWHSFNSGNWERIETSVQTFLTRRNINALLYTGTWGVQRLADERGDEQELFLSFDRNGRGRIPVPMFYYKVVIGERSGRGIVFVGVNNPHATVAEVRAGKYRLCADVSDQVDWVDWERANMSMGYSYACEVNEFARAVGHLPAGIRAVGLLV